MQQDFWYAYLKLLLPGKLTRVSNKFMNSDDMMRKIFDDAVRSQPNMQQTQKPKEPKSRECWMVQCLFEEVMKHPHKFSEMDTGYIKDLNTKFFNDANYSLSEKQIKWLEIIWEK